MDVTAVLLPQKAAFYQRFGQLLDEQRNAVGALDNPVCDLRRQLLAAGQALDQCRRIALAEAAQGQRRDLRVARPGRLELRAESDHHQRGKAWHSIRRPFQQFQRGLIDPLRVFEYEKHWLSAREALELRD